MNVCNNCGRKLKYKIINNRKRWVYGTATFVTFIFGVLIMIWLKLLGLILAIALNWYTTKVDYRSYCDQCDK